MSILIIILIVLTVYTCKFSDDFEKDDLLKVGAFIAGLALIAVLVSLISN